MMETDLWLEGIGFPRFSGRGCSQDLMPIKGQDSLFERSVNGDLIYLGDESSIKYRTIISCEDKDTPAFSKLWKGSLLRVGCLQFLSQMCEGSCVMLLKPYIPGSVSVFSKDHTPIPFTLNNQNVMLEMAQDDNVSGAYVSYRPILHMRLMDFSVSYNEWGAKVGWKLTLEEA